MEPPREHRAPLGKEREAAKAEEQQQSEELLSRTAAKRQKVVWEWQELRGFLEEQEQRLLSWLEERIYHSSQFSIIRKFAESAIHTILQIIYEDIEQNRPQDRPLGHST
ncbi:unnamed protein product [Caretta caretta]